MMKRLRRAVGADDHVKGPRGAPVTLVSYMDFECSVCGKAFVELKRLEAVAGHAIAFVFRHFPITQTHRYAMVAAEASEAAGAQGRFWDYHDMLFTHQRALAPPHLLDYAIELGLDDERFMRDVEEHRFFVRVRRDFLDGVRSGVNATPCFFINGARYLGPVILESLYDATAREATL